MFIEDKNSNHTANLNSVFYSVLILSCTLLTLVVVF